MNSQDGAMWDALQMSPVLGSLNCSRVFLGLQQTHHMQLLGQQPRLPSRDQAALQLSTYPTKGRLTWQDGRVAKTE